MKLRAASVPRRKSTVVTPVHAPGSRKASNEVHTRVSTVAYRLYEQRGRHDGHDVEDWLMAEQLIVGAGRKSAAETKETL